VPQDISKLDIKKAVYCQLPYENGGLVDDLIIYRLAENEYLIIVNAANIDKDFEWFKKYSEGFELSLENYSDDFSMLALQGPNAYKIIQKMGIDEINQPKFFTISQVKISDIELYLCRTGYTGEDGFELYCRNEDVCALWQLLLDKGVEPCGLGARDTLRLEAAMPLYGHEMNDELTPKEAGIGFFVKMDKPDFIGKQAILDKGTPTIKRVGLVVTGRGIAREHCPVFADGKEVGMVTSGTHCPFIGKAIAMAYLPTELAVVGNTVQIDVRGRKIDAEIIKLPFYKKPAKA
jgi:aminomethyltransferase